LLIQPKLKAMKRGGSYVWHLHPIVYNICARLAGEEEIEEEEEVGTEEEEVTAFNQPGSSKPVGAY